MKGWITTVQNPKFALISILSKSPGYSTQVCVRGSRLHVHRNQLGRRRAVEDVQFENASAIAVTDEILNRDQNARAGIGVIGKI